MRMTVTGLYLADCAVGLYWAVYLTLTGLYGVPFSKWYWIIFLGSGTLLVGTILRWTSFVVPALWLCLVGAFVLASYFVIATSVLIGEGRMDPVRAAIALLVTTCVIVSVIEVHEWQQHRQIRLPLP
jgi:hypothetical protein